MSGFVGNCEQDGTGCSMWKLPTVEETAGFEEGSVLIT